MSDKPLSQQRPNSNSSEKQLTLAENHIEKQEQNSESPSIIRDNEFIPIGETLKILNDTMMEVFSEVREAKIYKLMPSFSNAIIKQLEFQAKLVGDIEPEQQINVLNISVVKQEISSYVNNLFESGNVDITKVNSKEFIDGDIVEVQE